MPVQRLLKSEQTTLTRCATLLKTISKMFNDEEAATAAESVSQVAEKYADEKEPAAAAK